jgi:hypothetical protein
MATNRERNKSAIAHMTYQDVSPEQQTKIDAIRKAGQVFAKIVIKNTESGPESTLAQRHIEDALNRAIRSVIFEFADVDPSGGQASAPVPKRRGRPPGSKNLPVKETLSDSDTSRRGVKRRTNSA